MVCNIIEWGSHWQNRCCMDSKGLEMLNASRFLTKTNRFFMSPIFWSYRIAKNGIWNRMMIWNKNVLCKLNSQLKQSTLCRIGIHTVTMLILPHTFMHTILLKWDRFNWIGTFMFFDHIHHTNSMHLRQKSEKLLY